MKEQRVLKLVPVTMYRIKWAGKKRWFLRHDNYWTANACEARPFPTQRMAEKHLRRIGKKGLGKVEPFTQELLRPCAA